MRQLGLFVALCLSTATHAAEVPASMVELKLSSNGERMNGILYRPTAAEARPLVILLHGFPGNERNLDIAQAARSAGFNSLYFSYRGTWGSAGTMSYANGLQDVAAVLAWARQPENAARYGIDPQRIALLGHSYGGWLALSVGAQEKASVCVAGMAPWNAGLVAKRFDAFPQELKAREATYDSNTLGAGAPLKASTAALLQELVTHRDDWDYQAHAQALAKHKVFLVAATGDGPASGAATVNALADSIRAAGGAARVAIYEDDHGFNLHRSELVQAMVNWLKTDCFAK